MRTPYSLRITILFFRKPSYRMVKALFSPSDSIFTKFEDELKARVKSLWPSFHRAYILWPMPDETVSQFIKQIFKGDNNGINYEALCRGVVVNIKLMVTSYSAQIW